MTNSLFSALQTGDALTDNGAVTNSTTQSKVLDLFFLAGACRNQKSEDIKGLIQQAWIENPQDTLRVIFWAGDIRQGAGERRFFKLALEKLKEMDLQVLKDIIELVPEYNRWDSLFHLNLDEVLTLVKDILHNPFEPNIDKAFKAYEKNLIRNKSDKKMTDLEMQQYILRNDIKNKFRKSVGTLAKWMPRHYNKEHNDFRIAFQKKYKLNDATYRKLIATLSKTVEQQMSAKQWSEINYEHVPSVAANKYRPAFYRHDQERYGRYVEDVKSGEKKINASAIFPHDIYKAFYRSDDSSLYGAIDAQWDSLPNYLEGSNERMLPVCDVSGSMDGMDGLPVSISIALGIYFSQRNTSVFKDGFITFTEQPKLQLLTGTFTQKCQQFDRGPAENTNLQKVFELILRKAKENNLPEEQMPTTILIISDMEFDSCKGGQTNFQAITQLYAQSGYTLPKVVFWNVNGRGLNLPITKNDKAILVSGASPSVIKAVLSGKADPMEAMYSVIHTDRYNEVLKFTPSLTKEV